MLSEQSESLSLVVNAGGQSRRMGQAKALLPLPRTGTPLILHIVRRLLPLVSGHVVVVTNDDLVADVVREVKRDLEPLRGGDGNRDSAHGIGDLVILHDQWAEGGALGGLATGLAACPAWAMVVACDMPLVDKAIFTRLVAAARDNPQVDAVIARINGQAQPFHGVWHPRAVSMLAAHLQAGELRVQSALAALNVTWMDEHSLAIAPDTPAFCNVNTPDEWAAVAPLLEEQA